MVALNEGHSLDLSPVYQISWEGLNNTDDPWRSTGCEGATYRRSQATIVSFYRQLGRQTNP